MEQVEGVRFTELFARLPTDRAATGDEACARCWSWPRRPSRTQNRPGVDREADDGPVVDDDRAGTDAPEQGLSAKPPKERHDKSLKSQRRG